MQEQKLNTTAGTVVTPVTYLLNPRALAFARERGLSLRTLEVLGVASGITYFPGLEYKSEALFFKYEEGWKARSFPEKSFVAGGGFRTSFWNLQNVLASNTDTVWIVEGELDALSLVEAGIPYDQVLSVPNGAREKASTIHPKELKGYSYVEEALKQGLNRINKFIWCGDVDEPGLALRADMVRILGPARFHIVDWPEGAKDANDLLCSDGPQSLRELVTDGSRLYPVEGLYSLSQLPEPPLLTLWHSGFPEWESKVILAPRTLSVVTGQPGHGKTMLFSQIWYQVVKNYELIACVASFETRAKPHLRRQLRTLYTGKLERHLTNDEIIRADKWIEDHYLFLMHPEQRPSLDWILEMAEIAVIRHGARIIQIDPWNRLEGSRSSEETETEYIGRCLRALHLFANDLNCHVQIIAHPAKMDSRRRGTNEPPLLEDISSSKNWENMVDQGFVIHRPEIYEGGERKTLVNFHHKKARFEELGYPCKLALDYKIDQGKYVSIDYNYL